MRGDNRRAHCVYILFGIGAAVLGEATTSALGQCQANELAKLTASDAAAGDEFGISVAGSGDVTVVGARFDDDNGIDSGSAYVFRWNGSAWLQEAKLSASDGSPGDQFGFSVSISGDVAVIGAALGDGIVADSGAAYVFVKPPGGWVTGTQTAKLTASDGAFNDGFGGSVSISGDVAVVGAVGGDGPFVDTGSAYVFVKDPGGWVDMTQTAKLTGSDGLPFDQFGSSVSISGDVAVIGALGGDTIDLNTGEAYIFEKPPGGWVDMPQTAILLALDGAPNDQLGFSVSISGDTAMVGAPGDDDNGDLSGSAYVFEKPPGGWEILNIQTAKLTASDAAAGDQFGISVSISGGVIGVGAYLDDDNGDGSGSAYIYVLSGVDCNRNGQPDACDIALGVSSDCNANGIPDECDPVTNAADITGPGGVPDGCVDAFDLGALLAAWCSEAGGNPCGTCGP
ncbi:MAG: FG-GAP repeat protein, partial [Planctomycetota bacterium]|nr:FG-GAP repeat protein [Planctomycetota bacterium]